MRQQSRDKTTCTTPNITWKKNNLIINYNVHSIFNIDISKIASKLGELQAANDDPLESLLKETKGLQNKKLARNTHTHSAFVLSPIRRAISVHEPE